MPIRGEGKVLKEGKGGKWETGRETPDNSLAGGAKFALALMMRLAMRAVEHRLPMKLDY